MKRYPIKRWSLFDEIERAMEMPRTEMKETKKEIIFTAELPCVEKDNIKLI